MYLLHCPFTCSRKSRKCSHNQTERLAISTVMETRILTLPLPHIEFEFECSISFDKENAVFMALYSYVLSEMTECRG